jgi:hypothetical protein
MASELNPLPGFELGEDLDSEFVDALPELLHFRTHVQLRAARRFLKRLDTFLEFHDGTLELEVDSCFLRISHRALLETSGARNLLGPDFPRLES